MIREIIISFLVASVVAMVLVLLKIYPQTHGALILAGLGVSMALLTYLLSFYQSSVKIKKQKRSIERRTNLIKILMRRYRWRQKAIVEELIEREEVPQSEFEKKYGEKEARQSLEGLVKARIIRRRRAGKDYIITLNV